MLLPGKFYERLDYRLYAWPGHGMPDAANGYQYVEGEYMKAEEYDDLIKDFSGFLMRTFMPRAFGALESFSMLPPLINVIELPVFYFMPYAAPQVQAAHQALIDAGQAPRGVDQIRGRVRHARHVARLPCPNRP